MEKAYIICIVLSILTLTCAIAAIILHKWDTSVLSVLTAAILAWGAIMFYRYPPV